MTPVEREAARTSENLRQFYRMGVLANEAARSEGYGAGVNDRIAEKHDRKASTVTHARIFARLIEEDELEAICKLRNTKGLAFGPGLPTKLFPLKKRKQRDRFLQLWREQYLSARQLDQLVKAEFGKSARYGRKVAQRVSSADAAISRLYDLCSSWLKWYKQLGDENVGHVSAKQLPARIQKQLKATMAEVEKLRNILASQESAERSR